MTLPPVWFHINYHRNYNWASGFSIKLGLNGSCLQNRLSFAVNNQFYKLYTKNTLGSDVNWSESPEGKPVNVNGDESIGSFYHLEGEFNYKLFGSLFLSARFDLYSRSTHYKGGKRFENVYASNWLRLSYKLCHDKKKHNFVTTQKNYEQQYGF